ncbi:alanine--tRNA ligase [uncultured Oscillibacter sp.]|uniref:alanine--tRNA ligase n=1 Tax=uncultured Oscillibacter sp. TaxID=876091 RepID=UPI0025D1CE88|nr:alanine--tRNA ligase [uncultured Oscillibacter sp.]
MAHPVYGLNELREMFLSYFESKGHLRLPSFSLIPHNDASLLLINSGMAPMKTWFTREEEPPRNRVCTCQKCIRTGDIENIGKTARHGTYFEMLGNFSFGDYFKKEAIPMSWEFLTQVAGLEADRLYPSIYEEDEEAFEIWNKDMNIPAERIFRFGKADNFWEHGPGPCGPCSEIYYDRGEKYGCGRPECTVGCECDRYIEIWNNVFSQFVNDGEGHYEEMTNKNIDTGMGLERLAVASQGVASLFDVDTVMHITNHVSKITGAHYEESAKTDVSLRVITDHIRSSVMMICDGVLPSNEGRGYVLRRLLRRAARHGKLLGVDGPFLYKVVATVAEVNKAAYPDVAEKEAYITKVVRTEEENFLKTLDAGMKIYTEMLAAHKEENKSLFSGADAFKLYDTYGFPLDLTAEMLEEEGMQVDEAGFRELMEQQRVRARKAREALGDVAWAGIDLGLDATPTLFTGYDHNTDSGTVLAIVAEDELRDAIVKGAEGVLVLDKTPFYAEMGGQVTDHGTISLNGAVFAVQNVQKDKAGKFLHHGVMESGELKKGDAVTSSIDVERRQAVRRAHSATHLLDAALKKVLGDHVHQAGSLVEPDRLRFDFTHFSAITAEELSKIQRLVNDEILAGLNVGTQELPVEEAKKLGAVALFGEKYGKTVRVVSMGEGEELASMEFCGGTHLDNTAKVGPFRIRSEAGIASGVRRIEATVGKASLEIMNRNQEMLFRAAELLKSNPADLADRAEQVMLEMRELRREVERYQAQASLGDAQQFLMSAKAVGGLKIVTHSRPGTDANALRQMGDFLRDKEPGVVAVLASAAEEKITFLAVCGKEAVAKGIKAGELVKLVSGIAGGSGGGKPDSAMGGGKDLLKLDDALAAVDDFVAGKLK